MIVQDRGSNLSGGEKQGIALAAVIFNPEILLLDEPSSAMDEKGKNMIFTKGFDKKKQGHCYP